MERIQKHDSQNSHRVKVKICGITRPDDAQSATNLGADAIGLVFYQGSRRAVTIQQALDIVRFLPPFVSRVAWECRPLNEQRMLEAASHLVGEHDFTSYRSQACQAKNPVRTVRRLDICRRGDLIAVDIEANAFLHHMVRNIVGVLTAIGLDKQNPSWAKDVLAARDRTVGGVTAPPEGLYLMEVRYPERFNIPQVVKSEHIN